MHNNDVTAIYNELLENKTVVLSDELTDYDIDVLCHIIQNKIKREHPLLLFQKAERIIYIL